MLEIWKNEDLYDLPGEIWKEISGYHGLYLISNMGRVKRVAICSLKSEHKPHILTQLMNKHNLTVCLTDGIAERKMNVTYLVGNAFIDPKASVFENINKVFIDNRISNISVVDLPIVEMEFGKYWRDKELTTYPGEIWKDIKGYETLYSVSNFGRVRSNERLTSNGRLVKPRILSQNKMSQVSLAKDGHHDVVYVGILVGFHFMREKKENEAYLHINKIKTDNRLENLKIGNMSICQSTNFAMGININTTHDTVKKRYDKRSEDTILYEDGEPVAKICSSCNDLLPIEDFREINKVFATHDAMCRICQSKSRGNKNPGANINKSKLKLEGKKYCKGCDSVKDLENDFYNYKGSPDGKVGYCKNCWDKSVNEYYKKKMENGGREEFRKKKNEYYNRNKEEINRKRKNWRKKRKELGYRPT